MRLALSVNGRHIATAPVPAKGYLGAHLNLSAGIGTGAEPDRIWMGAIDTSDDVTNTHSKWPAEMLQQGDLVRIELLPDGESDLPESTTVTSDRAENLLIDERRARELIAMVEAFDQSLSRFLEKSREVESPEEFRKLAYAVGSVWTETERSLLLPTFRRHTSLIPEERKGELL